MIKTVVQCASVLVGYVAFDFVNELIDPVMPFQHYLVSEWRMPTRDELCDIVPKIRR